MKKKKIFANRTFVRLIRSTLGKYITRKYNVKVLNNITNNIAAPYIVLANHTNFWDPVFVATYCKEPIHFVTSDEYFRNGILNFFFRLLGAIPKTKFLSDVETVKNIIKIKNLNGIIGIFPEGQRNWDGKTSKILFATAKLIKNLKIPVVIAVMKGAYLSYPRWAKKPRYGEISISYNLLLNKEQIIKMSVEEIYTQLSSSLDFDEYEFQSKNMIEYNGNNLAENLELLLYKCPHCNSIGKMRSNKNNFKCLSCGYEVLYNKYGYFEANREKLYFSNLKDWCIWQDDELYKLIALKFTQKSSDILISDKNVLLFKGIRLKPLKKFRIGEIKLFIDKLVFTSLRGENISFEFSKIFGLNVQHNDRFEFYYENILYRFNFNINHTSAYKWVTAITFLVDLNKNNL